MEVNEERIAVLSLMMAGGMGFDEDKDDAKLRGTHKLLTVVVDAVAGTGKAMGDTFKPELTNFCWQCLMGAGLANTATDQKKGRNATVSECETMVKHVQAAVKNMEKPTLYNLALHGAYNKGLLKRTPATVLPPLPASYEQAIAEAEGEGTQPEEPKT